MYIVLGATGHVGSAVADRLLEAGEDVTVVTRNEAKGAVWRSRGATVAIVDVADADALRAVFRRGRRAFLLNPPAAPSTDTDVREHRTLAGIVQAVEGSGLETLVVESTYGAQPGESCGDLSVLFDLEEALRRQPVPTTALRAAYYMSNFDPLLEMARQGTLPTMYPAEPAIPMVAPTDLGAAAARLLREPAGANRIRYVEGPARYSSGDVAAAFASALGRPVELAVTPSGRWEEAFRNLGFSAPAAASYALMTAASVDGDYDMPSEFGRGATTLTRYIEDLVNRER